MLHLSKIVLLKNTPFKPHSRPSIRLIRPRLLTVISKLKYIPAENSKDQYSDIKTIAKKYGIKLTIHGNLSTAGIAHFDRRIKICVVDNGRCSTEKIRKIFSHEFAHIMQKDAGIWEKDQELSLSESLRFEQEAESAAVIIYKTFFPHLSFDRKNFMAYFNEKDILFHQNFCGDSKNDLFCFKIKDHDKKDCKGESRESTKTKVSKR